MSKTSIQTILFYKPKQNNEGQALFDEQVKTLHCPYEFLLLL